MTLLWIAAPALVLMMAIELSFIAWRHAAPTPTTTAASITLGTMNLVFNTLLKPIPMMLAVAAATLAPISITSSAWTWVICFILDDLVGYWIHRMTHRTGWGWSDHIAHHSAREFNFATAVRLGSVGALTPSVIAPVPLVLSGFPVEMVLTVHALNALYQFFVHTEAVGTLPRPIEILFNTPAHHRVHHASNPSYIDCNYGGVFIIWDRIFGTFRALGPEPPVYGTADGFRTENPLRIAFEPLLLLLVAVVRALPDFREAMRILFGPPRDWWSAGS